MRDDQDSLVANMAVLANEEAKQVIHQHSNKIKTSKEFKSLFIAKIHQRGKGGPFENLSAFKKFDTRGNGYTTFDDMMRFAASWNLNCTEEVRADLRKTYIREENWESGIIEFDDFVQKVLPRDFSNAGEAAMAFKRKMADNFKHMHQAFRDIDRDKSGTIDKSEIVMEMNRMNMNIDDEVARAIAERFDFDGDGEIDFSEFSKALSEMTLEDFMPRKSKSAYKSNVGLLWDEAEKDRKKPRPMSVASLHSVASDESDLDNQVGENDFYVSKSPANIIHYSEIQGKFLVEGVAVDLEQVLRDKIYRKRGGVNNLRKCFKALDKSSDGVISRREFRKFLAPFNLNLDVSALSKLVGLFDVNGDNRVDFNEFCKKVLPDDYARTATKTEMIGIPAMTHNRQRRVVKPTTPFTTGLAGPSSTATILGLTFKSPSKT